jgi:hypothetical protein
VNGTPYAWFVFASDEQADSPWSAGGSFRIVPPTVALPPAPTLLSPDGPVAVRDPLLKWQMLPGSPSYEVLVQRTDGVSIDVTVGCWSVDGVTCQFQPNQPLDAGKAYAWFVRAVSDAGIGPWSAGSRIVIPELSALMPPPTPQAVAPSGTTPARKPVLFWQASPNADRYRVVVQNTFGIAVDSEAQCAGTLCFLAVELPPPAPVYAPFAPPPAPPLPGTPGVCFGAMYSVNRCYELADGAFNLFIQAVNSNGASAWSAPLSFVVAAGPPMAPQLLSPQGSAGLAPTYSWSASTGADSYELVVQNTNGVTVMAAYDAWTLGCYGGLGTCTVTPAAWPGSTNCRLSWGTCLPLAGATQYAWFVRASIAGQAGAWSDGKSFTTP